MTSGQIACGHRFTLRNFPRTDQNVEHLIVSVNTKLEIEPQRSVATDADDTFECAIEAVVSRLPFRPARVTPRPFVHGPQTAIVTGPGGEEIYVISGKGRLDNLPIGPGDFIFTPPGEGHTLHAETEVLIHVLLPEPVVITE